MIHTLYVGLQVHSRIHKLDQQERERQHRMSEQATEQGLKQVASLTSDEHEGEEDEEDDDERAVANQPSHARRGLFRYWDSEVQRQREAKAAMLAIRKHMRMARAGRVRPEALARANSSQLRQVAAEFLLGGTVARAGASPADAQTGAQEAPTSRTPVKYMSAVLCFDEMQVRATSLHSEGHDVGSTGVSNVASIASL